MTGPALAAAAVATVVLATGFAGGCGDQSAPAERESASTTAELITRKGVVGREPRQGGPNTAPGARVMTLPSFGTLRWRCDASRRPTRYGMSLGVASNGATLTGTVKTAGSKPTPFTVQPGDEIALRPTPSPAVHWDVRFDHKPLPQRLVLDVSMAQKGPANDCLLDRVSATLEDR